jgi:hypothetical protein
MRGPAVVAAVMVVAAMGPAFAQPAATPPAIEYDVTSYRTTTLIVDGASLTVVLGSFVLASQADTDVAAAVGFGIGTLGLLLATPIVHIARGHRLRSVGSFFMRVGIGTLGAFVGAGIRKDSRRDVLNGAIFGGTGGLAVASGLDAMYLTSERTPRSLLTPVVSPVPGGGAQLVIGTTF